MRATPQTPEGEAEFPAEFSQILAAAVPEFNALEVVPDTLVGIEVRGIGWQACEMEPLRCTASEEVLDRLAAMDWCTVPDDEQVAWNLAQELPEESHHRRTPEGGVLDAGEQPPVGGDGADDGQVVIRQRRAQDGRLAARGIRPRHERQWIESGLV